MGLHRKGKLLVEGFSSHARYVANEKDRASSKPLPTHQLKAMFK
jgi:hypothetical protein